MKNKNEKRKIDIVRSTFLLLFLRYMLFEPCKINHRLTNLDHILTPVDENVDVTEYILRV